MNKDNLKYKLVDKEGFLASYPYNNKYIWDNFLEEEVIHLSYIDVSGNGMIVDFTAISKEEFRFFEPVQDNHLWDGKETLEVGMLVQDEQKSKGVISTVLFIKEDKVCLESKLDLNVTYLENISTLMEDPKEAFCAEVLQDIRGSHLDFAFDTTHDINKVAALCWDKLKEGVDD